MRTTIFIFVFGLMTVIYLRAQTSNCYEIKQTVSLSGYVNTQSYPLTMFDTICNLVKKVDQIDNNNVQFKVFSYDLYPIMAYVNPMDGLEYQVNQIKEELKDYSEIAAVFKLFEIGTIKYEFYLKLPNTGKFETINELQVAAIESSVESTMNLASTTHYFGILSEILGFQQFRKYIEDIDSGTLSIAQFEDNGFEKMVETSIDAKLSRTGIIKELHLSKLNVIDYNGYQYDGQPLIDHFLNFQSEFSTLDYLLVFTGKENTQQINNANSLFKNSNAKIKIWIHLDYEVPMISTMHPNTGITDRSSTYNSYILTDNNLTKEEANSILESQLNLNLKDWTNENFEVDEQGNVKNPDCSFSWQWGLNCIVPQVNSFIGDSQLYGVGDAAKLNVAMNAGLLDGLLGTIEYFFKASRGFFEGMQDILIAGGSLMYLWKVDSALAWQISVAVYEALIVDLEKAIENAKKKLKHMWTDLKETWNVMKNAIKNWNEQTLRNTVDGIMEAMVTWIGKEFGGSYSAAVGYHVGLVAFGVVVDYFTAGALRAVKGTSFGLKLIDIIKNIGNRKGLFSKLSTMLDEGSKVSNGSKKAACLIPKLGCFIKDTPILMARHPFRNTAKAYVMAALPIISVPIQDVQLLDYAVAHKTVNSSYGLTANADDTYIIGKDPYTSDQQRQRDQYTIDEDHINEVVFEQVQGTSTAKLALHDDWIKDNGYSVDAIVNMNLPEQGVSGPFKITSIKHITPQKKPVDEDESDEWEYRPVTGLFVHESNDLWKIKFTDGTELGVTNNHPIFSVSKGDWQHAGHLEIGEEVLAKNGNVKVESKERDHKLQPVYNLEVKDLHNFLVGDAGVVVHNVPFCSFLKSLFAKYSKWRKAEPEWALDENKVQQMMQKMRDGITEFGDDHIITTTYNGKTYIIDGHHRLKAAKNLKAEGLDIELPHSDIDPAKIGELTGNRFKNIQQLINESFDPDE